VANRCLVAVEDDERRHPISAPRGQDDVTFHDNGLLTAIRYCAGLDQTTAASMPGDIVSQA